MSELSSRHQAAYHAAMCLSEAMNEVVRRCSHNLPVAVKIRQIGASDE